MSLKKTDKIIAIIGVLILVIAGIGIFLYVGNEETTSNDTGTEEKMYDVVWGEPKTGTMSVSDFVGKKSTYSEPFDVIATEPDSVITKVDVYLIWKDDVVSKILKKGQDKLTAIITLSGGESLTHESTGSADNTTAPLPFTVNSVPVDMTGFSSESEAQDAIDSQYSGMDKASFTTEITIKTGEKIGIRPLKLLRFLKDKGNDFTIEISYTYYTPIIVDNSIENPPPVESGNPAPPYSQTNYPGKQ